MSGNRAPSGAEIYNAAGVAVSANDFNVLGHSGLTNVQAFRRFAPGASDITATSNGNTPKALGAILNTTLASNGGPTKTHALVIGSPAIDAVGSGCPPPNTDQRGTSRPQGRACDVGAFEAPFVPTAAAGSLQFSAAAVSVNEGGANATITITRTGGSNGAVTVNYTTANATGPNPATAGADYTFTQGFVTFPDGDAANKSFQVPTLDDGDPEPSETVALSLSNATNGATLGTPNKALLTITDNDNQVTALVERPPLLARQATIRSPAPPAPMSSIARPVTMSSMVWLAMTSSAAM